MYAAICVDLLISNALFELVYVLVYLSCHIFVTRAYDRLAPLYPNPGYAPADAGSSQARPQRWTVEGGRGGKRRRAGVRRRLAGAVGRAARVI